jgi:dipeptide/tripeptide permease
MMTEISYSGYRFPPEIIQQAIWLWWLFAYFVVITIGMLYLSPIGVSLVSKIVPARMVSMTMGLWRDLVNFVGICGSARPIPW